MKTVLLTGASGFLGTEVARRLLQQPELSVIALVRAENQERAIHRLARAWWDYPELIEAIGTRVEGLCGDVALPQLGLDTTIYADVVKRVTHIIHTAADLRLNAPLDELRKTNVQGTANVVELARAIERDHGLKRLAHVSTAYVCGKRKGVILENDLTDEFGFSSSYEESKYEGERLVQAAKTELPISIFRPAMIVGNSRTGAIKTFNTVYVPWRLYLSGKLWLSPTSTALRLNIVPVDYVADAIVRLTFEPQDKGLTFHLSAPYQSLPTASDMVTFTRAWVKEHLNLNLPRPLFLSLPEFVTRLQPIPSSLIPLMNLLPYFSQPPHFQRDNVNRLLGTYTLDWRAFMPKLLEYPVYHGFMHRSERTVHEQILFRLEGHGPPITFHDLVEDKVLTHTGLELRQDMLRAASALQSLGIRKGDRVALVGFNSTRYLTLDVAIGLVGAVSVPLYYTRPPADLDAIVKASGAKLLCVGTPKLLERLDEFNTNVPIISFAREPLPETLPRNVLSWNAFLSLGKDPISTTAPVGFADLATLRYTSGTTGMPKGVVFNHQHLRWMGECMAALLPWKARTRRISYLSFLPMNHVVEGILATYSPYFIPAPLEIYFLEDFRRLEQALPRVRPAVFFSVPRVYEKVWEAFENNRLGQWYLGSSEDLFKKLLRPLVRWLLLRKAGLDHCVQQIVGSAPADDELLRAYQELGIEIHDAYGLSEAPLVTLNRVGANRVGTVGQALPQTEVTIAEDGEVLVKGPQVTSGYFGEGITQPFKNGWLLTGDLGSLSPEGNLCIEGRKKELIATAYGKKVHPVKVETLLKEIPGVAEAMLVGENRPYCVALLWLEPNRPLPESFDKAVLEANSRLSHPEQVKGWAVLKNDLSTEGGDLTANLKLKRQAVTKRFQAVIEALYRDATPPAGVLHVGRAEREAQKELV
jgi:long-chain acyl-CoA synthetase